MRELDFGNVISRVFMSGNRKAHPAHPHETHKGSCYMLCFPTPPMPIVPNTLVGSLQARVQDMILSIIHRAMMGMWGGAGHSDM